MDDLMTPSSGDRSYNEVGRSLLDYLRLVPNQPSNEMNERALSSVSKSSEMDDLVSLKLSLEVPPEDDCTDPFRVVVTSDQSDQCVPSSEGDFHDHGRPLDLIDEFFSIEEEDGSDSDVFTGMNEAESSMIDDDVLIPEADQCRGLQAGMVVHLDSEGNITSATCSERPAVRTIRLVHLLASPRETQTASSPDGILAQLGDASPESSPPGPPSGFALPLTPQRLVRTPVTIAHMNTDQMVQFLRSLSNSGSSSLGDLSLTAYSSLDRRDTGSTENGDGTSAVQDHTYVMKDALDVMEVEVDALSGSSGTTSMTPDSLEVSQEALVPVNDAVQKKLAVVGSSEGASIVGQPEEQDVGAEAHQRENLADEVVDDKISGGSHELGHGGGGGEQQLADEVVDGTLSPGRHELGHGGGGGEQQLADEVVDGTRSPGRHELGHGGGGGGQQLADEVVDGALSPERHELGRGSVGGELQLVDEVVNDNVAPGSHELGHGGVGGEQQLANEVVSDKVFAESCGSQEQVQVGDHKVVCEAMEIDRVSAEEWEAVHRGKPLTTFEDVDILRSNSNGVLRERQDSHIPSVAPKERSSPLAHDEHSDEGMVIDEDFGDQHLSLHSTSMDLFDGDEDTVANISSRKSSPIPASQYVSLKTTATDALGDEEMLNLSHSYENMKVYQDHEADINSEVLNPLLHIDQLDIEKLGVMLPIVNSEPSSQDSFLEPSQTVIEKTSTYKIDHGKINPHSNDVSLNSQDFLNENWLEERFPLYKENVDCFPPTILLQGDEELSQKELGVNMNSSNSNSGIILNPEKESQEDASNSSFCSCSSSSPNRDLDALSLTQCAPLKRKKKDNRDKPPRAKRSRRSWEQWYSKYKTILTTGRQRLNAQKTEVAGSSQMLLRNISKEDKENEAQFKQSSSGQSSAPQSWLHSSSFSQKLKAQNCQVQVSKSSQTSLDKRMDENVAEILSSSEASASSKIPLIDSDCKGQQLVEPREQKFNCSYAKPSVQRHPIFNWNSVGSSLKATDEILLDDYENSEDNWSQSQDHIATPERQPVLRLGLSKRACPKPLHRRKWWVLSKIKEGCTLL